MTTREQVYRRFGPLILEAMILVIKDEVNNSREWTRNFKNAVSAATSLADLKTRVAALPTQTERTNQQLLDALENKLGEIPRYDWMDETIPS